MCYTLLRVPPALQASARYCLYSPIHRQGLVNDEIVGVDLVAHRQRVHRQGASVERQLLYRDSLICNLGRRNSAVLELVASVIAIKAPCVWAAGGGAGAGVRGCGVWRGIVSER